ncbi:MAG TPA: dihydroorotase family protein [Solirubrobacteraceae bacterium]|nr:dihydroorotase family protein [Solirubrobacteraceae bacterium]
MHIDTRIRGGQVYTPSGLQEVDIAIRGERIVGLLDPQDPAPAASDIDAAGKHVLPGLIDLHAHTRVPGYEYKEDFHTCSQAAAVGGFTTIADMPNVEPPTDTVALFEEKREIAARDCIVDWGHLVSPTKLEEIPRLAAAGATGFKVFQVSGGYPHDPRLAMGESEKLYDAFGAIAETGLHCSIHPYNQPLMDRLSELAWAAGKPRTIETFAPIYTADVVWRSAVAVLIELQRETGARLHVLHTHAPGSIALLRQAKATGVPMTAAVDLKYYHLTRADAERQGPRAAPGGVITEDPARMEAIWKALNDGTIDIIDSDHAPHSLEDLERFREDPWTGPFGSPQYEYMLSVSLTDVNEGLMSLDTAVQRLVVNSAKLVGLYPRKGAIQVGSDADIVIIDLEAEIVARDADTYTKVKWTPYDGRTLKGGPVLTMLRGQVIARDGKVTGKPGYGRYIEGAPQELAGTARVASPGLSLRAKGRVAEAAQVA